MTDRSNMSGYSTEWDFSSARKWGETTRLYPDGTVVRLSRFANGTWVADRYPTTAHADKGLWSPDDPVLAGAGFPTVEAAAAAADGSSQTIPMNLGPSA